MVNGFPIACRWILFSDLRLNGEVVGEQGMGNRLDSNGLRGNGVMGRTAELISLMGALIGFEILITSVI